VSDIGRNISELTSRLVVTMIAVAGLAIGITKAL
jgi:hypothetical protein